MAAPGRTPLGTTHQPLRQAVLDELRRSIIEGRRAQGARLLEEELAEELAVSRNPVREALQALAVEGFVELEPRRGARVSTISFDRARELFEVRQTLEALVAGLAAERRTDEEFAELRAIVDAGMAACRTGQLDELPDLNARFHRALAAAARNRLLEETLERLTHVIQWVYTERITLRSTRSWSEHAAIVDAISVRDVSRASAESAAHIANARDAFFADTGPLRMP